MIFLHRRFPISHLAFYLVAVVSVSNCAPDTTRLPDFEVQPRPNQGQEDPIIDDLERSVFDDSEVEFLEDFHPEDNNDRYVAHCTNAIVRMIPGRKRNFWSYGYVHLLEAYPANCTLKYVFTSRSHPPNTLAKYGFRVTGTFIGPDIHYSTCTDTDYVVLNDTEGVVQTYCGTSATIDFITGSDYFEFCFISQEYSPRAKGFYVTIESIYMCGGLISDTTHGPTGFITSPFYPADYPPNTNCIWWFTSGSETTIKMECAAFLLEDVITLANGTQYCVDFLSLSYEAVSSDETTYFCNSHMDTLSKTIYSAGNTLLVNFRSDSTDHFSGFNCTYDFILFGI